MTGTVAACSGRGPGHLNIKSLLGHTGERTLDDAGRKQLRQHGGSAAGPPVVHNIERHPGAAGAAAEPG